VGCAHALLHDGNIVRHAPKLDDLVLQVGNRKGGAWITVARLPDRTRIQKITARQFNAQRSKGFAWARVNLQDLELRIPVGKASLMMRVAEESHASGGVQKPIEGLLGSENIFVFILKRTVDEHHSIRGERPARQS